MQARVRHGNTLRHVAAIGGQAGSGVGVQGGIGVMVEAMVRAVVDVGVVGRG
jgi:hypothetical protein